MNDLFQCDILNGLSNEIPRSKGIAQTLRKTHQPLINRKGGRVFCLLANGLEIK